MLMSIFWDCCHLDGKQVLRERGRLAANRVASEKAIEYLNTSVKYMYLSVFMCSQIYHNSTKVPNVGSLATLLNCRNFAAHVAGICRYF